ncbi:HNH endonuclease signature motif containing protein [Sphingobacterium sp. MYb388]|uniref:HNH endonuclease signature motif containing protein n=1 Tax=Sphingobacterium sp. MYb388 TaxID=2745437 RepID=UPI0030A200C0
MKSVFPIPEEVKAYWLNNWQDLSYKDLGAKFNYDGAVVNRFLKSSGIIRSKELSVSLRTQKIKGRTSATPEMDEVIKARYLTVPVKTLAKQLGVGGTLINSRLKALGLVIPKVIIEQRKKDSQIKRGNTPPNKGKKLEDFMSPETIEKFKKNTYRKGNIPHNAYNEIGKIVTRQKTDGTERYKYICLELGKWQLYQHYVWEKNKGPIPIGNLIRFIDGDSMNCDINNLECVTKFENLQRNNISDRAIATRFALTGRGNVNEDLRDEILGNYPDLIELRRKEILLRRELINQSKI